MRDRLRLGWMAWPMPKLRGRFSMSGFYTHVSARGWGDCGWGKELTLGAFLEPAFP